MRTSELMLLSETAPASPADRGLIPVSCHLHVLFSSALYFVGCCVFAGAGMFIVGIVILIFIIITIVGSIRAGGCKRCCNKIPLLVPSILFNLLTTEVMKLFIITVVIEPSVIIIITIIIWIITNVSVLILLSSFPFPLPLLLLSLFMLSYSLTLKLKCCKKIVRTL